MPQHAKRVRISRKSLRQPDEFQTIAGSVLTWAEQHVRELLVAAGLLVALGVVVVAAARYRTSREAAAAAAFQGARALLEAGKLPEAEKAFAELRRDYGTTSFGRLAPLYQGHALARAGDHAGAATAYEEFLAGAPPADYLRQEALDAGGRARRAVPQRCAPWRRPPRRSRGPDGRRAGGLSEAPRRGAERRARRVLALEASRRGAEVSGSAIVSGRGVNVR